ncbi:MAG: hypothetical protein U0234_02270 [Sandaracinus sp.]
MRGRSWGAGLAAFWTIACATPAASPPMSDCEHGLTWAECPGALASADPVLACDDAYGEQCYWFTGGLVAAGYSPWREGRWMPGCRPTDGSMRLARTDHVDLDVVLAPPTGAERSVTCTGESGQIPGALCGAGPHLFSASTRTQTSVVATVFDNNELYGTEMFIEVIESDTAPPRARVCYAPFTDVGPSFCPAGQTRACAVSGTVTIESLPPSVATQFPMDVHATFESGLVVDMHL